MFSLTIHPLSCDARPLLVSQKRDSRQAAAGHCIGSYPLGARLPAKFFFVWIRLALWLAPLGLCAEDSEAPAASGTSLFGMLQQGGWAMWPLGLLMLACLYLVFLCHALTGIHRFIPDGLAAMIVPSLRSRDFATARQVMSRHDTVLTRLLSATFAKGRPTEPDAGRKAMESAFIEMAEAEENHIGQWVNYLNVIATVAPMVGLLGTVSGMISAFQTIGDRGMGKPQELAGSIGEALITTASGLVIGIPAMIAYFYFRNRLTNRMIAIGQQAGALLDETATLSNAESPS